MSKLRLMSQNQWNYVDNNETWKAMGLDCSAQVRMLQVKMASQRIDSYRKQYGDCPVILVGDLNTDNNSEAIRWALSEGGFRHGHDVAVEFAHEENGYNYCMPAGPGKWQHLPFEKAIDHILVKGLAADAVRRFDRYESEEYCFLSDHAPVWIDVEI